MPNDIKRIYNLDKNKNHILFSIFEESDNIVYKYNILMNELKKIELPKSFSFEYLINLDLDKFLFLKIRFQEAKDKINNIAQEIRDLDKDVVRWNIKASDFVIKSIYIFPYGTSEFEVESTINYWNGVLKWRIDDIKYLISRVYDMINYEVNKYENRYSLAISIKFSFLFASFGYILALAIYLL